MAKFRKRSGSVTAKVSQRPLGASGDPPIAGSATAAAWLIAIADRDSHAYRRTRIYPLTRSSLHSDEHPATRPTAVLTIDPYLLQSNITGQSYAKIVP